MKKRLLPLLLALALLAGCAGPTGDSSSPKDDNTLTVVTTTYPLYLLASALTREVDGAAVLRLDTGSASCLHDYTLSVNDMKKLAQADVIALNGAELEEFMDDALDSSSALPIDCSQRVDLLPALDSHDVEEDHDHDDHDHDHDDHDHDHGDTDPHIWMDPQRYAQMAEALAAGLTQADPDHAGAYEAALNDVTARLRDWDADLRALFDGSNTSPPPTACPCWPPSRRRRAARPAPRRSWKSQRRSTITISPSSSPRSTAPMPPPRPSPGRRAAPWLS